MTSAGSTRGTTPRAAVKRRPHLSDVLSVGALIGAIVGVLAPGLILVVPSWGDTEQNAGEFAAPHDLGILAFLVALVPTVPYCMVLGVIAAWTWWWVTYRPRSGRTQLLLSVVGMVVVTVGVPLLVAVLFALSPVP